MSWIPLSVQPVSAIYCYPGDPPGVYQACLAYNQGIGQQVANQEALQHIQRQMNNTVAQINATDVLIINFKNQIAAQQALVIRTQAAIDDVNRQIRFGEADLIRIKAELSVRDQLLNARLRYIDSHGSVNIVQLVMTATSINQLMDRMVGVQQIAASDRNLMINLRSDHALSAIANTALGV